MARNAAVVGRTVELAALQARIDDARRGAGSALLLVGEPGVGKSALLDAAAATAATAGFTVLRCRGIEIEVELPYSGLHQLLIPLLGGIADLTERQRSVLEVSLGLEDGPPAAPLAVSMAVLTLVTQAASAQPVLAIVDDLHWLDEPSALVISFVARRIAHDPVLLLQASRAAHVPATAVDDRLAVTGLAAADTRELAQQQVGRSLPDTTIDTLVQATGGNPLALIETVRMLGDRVDRVGTALDEPLPASELIERGFRARMADLPPSGTTALTLLATALTNAADTLGEAAASLGLDGDPFDAVERAGLVERRFGSIAFSHPVLRSLAFHGAEPSLQRRCHAALAEVVTDPSARAWHAASAATRADESLAAALAVAADDLRRRGGFLAAARTLERAAQLTPDQNRRAERLLEAGRAARRTGRASWTGALLDEAFALAEPGSALRLHVENERIAVQEHTGSNAGLAERQMRLAADAAGVDVDLQRQALLIALGEGVVSGKMPIARRANELLAQLPLPSEWEAAIRVAGGWGSSALTAGIDRTGAIEAIRRSGHLAVEHPSYQGLSAANSLTVIDDRELAREVIDATLAVVRDTDDLHTLSFALWGDAYLRYLDGDWARAEHAATQCEQLCDAADLDWQHCLAFGLLAVIRGSRGDATTVECAAAGRALVDRFQFGNPGLYPDQGLGLLELGFGRAAAARIPLQRAMDWATRAEYREPNLLSFRWDLAEALILDGDRHRAEREVEALRALAIDADRVRALAAVARLDGLLAPAGAFAEHFGQALRGFDEVRSPFESARTHLAFGRRLRQAGDRSEAVAQLRAAHDLFLRLGAAGWLEQTANELELAGAGRVDRHGSADLLTAQEKVVADCVARGMTNKEAAAHLFLTTKTIEWHLRQIYRKLGIKSRVQLAQYMTASHDGAAPERSA